MKNIIYSDSSLKRYLNDLSSMLPAPGGGSAAALNAALGSALITVHTTIFPVSSSLTVNQSEYCDLDSSRRESPIVRNTGGYGYIIYAGP